ncbi:Mov34/MPN/PAD-1 family protein, partial [Vibrio cholerae]|uniref:Mov34/MPN/PAD-1 family protein n=1 Tax=Vibrio cholerae TaxID=666 RepID=UPI002157CD4C
EEAKEISSGENGVGYDGDISVDKLFFFFSVELCVDVIKRQRVNEAFERSAGTHLYLGEWHTHPEDRPFPSATDRHSWRRNIVSDESMLLLIVGRKDFWLGKKERELITVFKKIESSVS